MLRTITVTEDSSLEEVHSDLLKAKAPSGEAEASLERTAQLNPTVDRQRIEAGTVLVIADSPHLKAKAGEPVAAAPWDSFRSALEGALGDAVASATSARDARAAERARTSKILNSASFAKALAASGATKAQAKEMAAQLKAQEGTDRDAAEALAATQGAVLAALAGLDKIIR